MVGVVVVVCKNKTNDYLISMCFLALAPLLAYIT
jgi:hypothetical protein